MKMINPQWFEASNTDNFAKTFKEAKPYKHLVIDNFLKQETADQIFAEFPKEEVFNKKYKGLNEFKAEGSNFVDFPAIFSDLKKEINQPEFYQWMSKVTGIDSIYSVEDALGSGLHQGGNGSFLDVHIDFNIHVERGIHRRANLLIFFNKDWKEEYGGHTELWNADMTKLEKKVLPIFNRCLIFETNEISYHGYSAVKLPPEVTRKSFYGYFYTDLKQGEMKYHDTVFKARPTDSGTKKLITPIKEKSKTFVKRQLKRLGITWL